MRKNCLEPSGYPRAQKRWGQHFLIDPNIARKIARLVDIHAGDRIVEIGPGQGFLTQFFLQLDVSIVAVEVDQRYVEFLRQRFSNNPNLVIIHQDFLKVDLSELAGTANSLKVVGNIPYNITSPVLFKLVENRFLIQKAVLMVQKELAQRIVAVPGSKDYGIVSILMQTFCSPRWAFSVSAEVFRPKPKVESAVIEIFFKSPYAAEVDDVSRYMRLVKTAFQQRRKKLRNSLRGVVDFSSAIACNFDFDRRPEQISIEQWINLYKNWIPPEKNC